MDKLKELQRQRRVILPELRKLQLKASRNQLTSAEKNSLNNIEIEYGRVSQEIADEEQNFVQRKFGADTLSEWNSLKELESKPYTSSSEVGQKILSLKTKLKEVSDLIEKTKY